MRGLAAEDLAVAEGSDEPAFADGDLAAHGDEARAAFDGATFEAGIVGIHVVRLS